MHKFWNPADLKTVLRADHKSDSCPLWSAVIVLHVGNKPIHVLSRPSPRQCKAVQSWLHTRQQKNATSESQSPITESYQKDPLLMKLVA